MCIRDRWYSYNYNLPPDNPEREYESVQVSSQARIKKCVWEIYLCESTNNFSRPEITSDIFIFCLTSDSPRTRTQEMLEAEEWISASFKERIFVAMQSSEDLRALKILLEITFDRFVFCCVLTLILCFEDSFAVDWSIIVDNAIFQFRCSYQTTWIYFILMWMKRRIQKVKKFELHMSTSTTSCELQLHNWYNFFKI